MLRAHVPKDLVISSKHIIKSFNILNFLTKLEEHNLRSFVRL